MYICICNALTDRDVKSAIQTGASSVPKVYSANQCKPQCGKCGCSIRNLLREMKTSPQPA